VVSLSAPPDSREIRRLLIEKFFEDPDRTREVCIECGLWEQLQSILLHPLRIAWARSDYNAFIELVVKDPDTGESVIQQEFHRVWQEMISRYRWCLIGAPRGHGKTVQIVARCVWELGRNQNKRIKIIGSSDDKAKEILGLIREMIEDPLVKEIFPSLQVDATRGDTKGAFFVIRSIAQRDPSVEASGWSSSGAGGRADILICDDVVDAKNAIINPTMREQVKKVLKEVWFSLVANNGKVVWICTPYHQDDASHEFKRRSVDVEQVLLGEAETGKDAPWVRWWKPAIGYDLEFDNDGNPIWTEAIDPDTGGPRTDKLTGEVLYEQKRRKTILWGSYWTEEKLEERRAVLGERTFARQYLLNAMSDEERTFSEASLEKSFDYSLANIGDGIEDSWPTYAGVDLASALSERGKYTVIVTLARNPQTRRLHFKRIWRQKVRFGQILKQIDLEFDAHRWRKAYVESNGFQIAVEQATEDTPEYRHIPIEGFTTTGFNKKDEQQGLPGMDVAFGKGLFAIPAKRFPLDGDDGSELALLMDELRSHPGGETSDIVMALWFAYRAAIEHASNAVENYLQAIENN
jgi:hypothetical protein